MFKKLLTPNISQSRLGNIDFLKGISILFVIITHYGWTDQQRAILLFPFWVDMAVPIFLIINGYLTCGWYLSTVEGGKKRSFRMIINKIGLKYLRLLLPFAILYFIEMFIMMGIMHNKYSLLSMIEMFVVGGIRTAGSYFIPIMLQVVLITPLICAFINTYPFLGVVVMFFLNVLFEIVKSISNLDPNIYRLCVFRYLFVISFGVYLYVKQYRLQKSFLFLDYLLFAVGTIYLVVYNYTEMKPMITNQWKNTSVFAVLFLLPIMEFLIKQKGLHSFIIELIGRASYNVFLVQMIYYWLIADRVYGVVSSVFMRVLSNVIICTITGIIFYYIENPVTRKIVGVFNMRCFNDNN